MVNINARIAITYTYSPPLKVTAVRTDMLARDLKSFREPLTRAVKQVMTKSIYRNFQEGGRRSWEPLVDATWARRASEGWLGGGPLLKTGLLARTASQINVWSISSTTATIMDLPAKVWYGKIHQSGAQSKWVNIPSRPFLVFQEEDERAIGEIFEKWLSERVRDHMGKV